MHPWTLTAALTVALANGANDNFKGVATLFGSGTARYRPALAWATIATLAGSITAIFVGATLARAFSGAGLLPARAPAAVLPCAGLGAALVIALAAWRGLPISTTHALLGGLIGAGLASGAGALHYGVLLGRFVTPLLLSPLLAIAITWTAYPLLSRARHALGVEPETCLCLGQPQPAPLGSGAAALARTPDALPVLHTCERRYAGAILGLDAQRVLDRAHFMSAGLPSFARGLNDTPKIAALLFAGSALAVAPAMALVAAAIALGGWWGARRVGETLSHRITPLNHGQGFTANAATALLVISASAFALPVSLTHVSVASLAGIGASTGAARWGELRVIALAWCVTLPLAALASAAVYLSIGSLHP